MAVSEDFAPVEYKVVMLGDLLLGDIQSGLEKGLNAYGVEGWDLVEINWEAGRAIFKRS
jgi:hypothetical protein